MGGSKIDAKLQEVERVVEMISFSFGGRLVARGIWVLNVPAR
jgi:hypothetical protein